jgi:thymidylate synthase
MYCQLTGLQPGRLWVVITDAHIYNNQIEQCWEQIGKVPDKPFPTLSIKNRGQQSIKDFVFDDFTVEGYIPGDKVTADVVLAGGYTKDKVE